MSQVIRCRFRSGGTHCKIFKDENPVIKCTNKTSPVPCEVKSIGPKIGQLHRKRKR